MRSDESIEAANENKSTLIKAMRAQLSPATMAALKIAIDLIEPTIASGEAMRQLDWLRNELIDALGGDDALNHQMDALDL